MLQITVDKHLLNIGQALEQSNAQQADPFILGAHLHARNTEVFPHTDDLMRHQRT